MKVIRTPLAGLLLMALCATSANAGVVVGGTRVIYDAGKKEASLSVNNPDTVPYLIQSWVETQTGGADKAPFIITPPLFRLDPGQQNIMRIVSVNATASDKEQMFWLNIKSIPSAPKKENTLQVAVKTKIKLIYRPASLKGAVPEDLAEKLSWKITAGQVQVTNPTSFYMNFNQIAVNGKTLPEVSYVAPGSSASFKLPAGVGSGAITYKLINDYGGVGEVHKPGI